MDKTYYHEYYKLEREHWWFVVRGRILLEHILPYTKAPDLSILNVGAATGRTSELLSDLGEVTSIEYDDDCRNFANALTGLGIKKGTILDLELEDNSFHLSCAFDVIEHVENDKKAVAELVRVTKTNGLIFITVPAFQFLWSEHDIVNHHFRRYTRSKLKQILPSEEISLVHKTYFNSLLFFPIAIFRVLSRLVPARFYRKGSGADNTLVANDSFVNKLMFRVFETERKLLRKVKFPFGVSLMVILRKK